MLEVSTMASSNPKGNRRSDKFPLTLHPTGQYCKKIKGRLYYFGTNKKKALQRYLEEATFLHGGRGLKRRSLWCPDFFWSLIGKGDKQMISLGVVGIGLILVVPQ